MAFSYYLSTEIIALVITKSYRDSVGVRLYINAFNLCHSRHLCFIPETLTV